MNRFVAGVRRVVTIGAGACLSVAVVADGHYLAGGLALAAGVTLGVWKEPVDE